MKDYSYWSMPTELYPYVIHLQKFINLESTRGFALTWKEGGKQTGVPGETPRQAVNLSDFGCNKSSTTYLLLLSSFRWPVTTLGDQ